MLRPRLPLLVGSLLAVGVCTTQAAPIQWPTASGGNDHWYELVPAVSIFAPVSFGAARADALSRTHLGFGGYLATVTSAEEQAFIDSNFTGLTGFGGGGSYWLGGSDELVEGEWRWLDGPEAGDLFTFTDWGAGQPGASPQADFLAQGTFNGAATTWVAAEPTGTFGYLVEYSPIPEPAVWGLLPAGLALLAAGRLRRRSR